MTAPESRRHRIQVLGPVSADPEITGPRRIAVLVYLTLARPRGLHSRDTLIGLLWPEADQAAGRHALRNALHSLRQTLGAESIVASGDGLVGVDASHIECDALALEADLAAGRVDQALSRYHGELLQGFFVSDAPEFERWVDGERRRLKDAVLAAAWSLAESRRAAGDMRGALVAARRAGALAPDDEPSLRQLLEYLNQAGDRGAALRAYEEFADRLKADYEAEPAAETQALARALRMAPSADEVTAATPPTRTNAAAPVVSQAEPSFVSRAYNRWWPLGAVAALIAVGGSIALRGRRSGSMDPGKTIVVLPMDNRTGDSTLNYVSTGVAEGVARRLEGLGGLHVRSGARSEWPDSVRRDFKTIAARFGAGILMKSALGRAADSLEVRVSLIDVGQSPTERPIITKRFAATDLDHIEREIVASVAGALFRVPLMEMPRVSAQAIDPESYRLTMEGFHQLLTTRNLAAARKAFTDATTLDQFNARAFAGLSSTWSSQLTAAMAPFDEAADRVEAAASRAVALDSLQGTAWANLAIVRALKSRDLSVGVPLLATAERVDPSNPEVFLVASALYRHAWRWDEARDAIRIARRLDPLTPYYFDREATVELCANRPRVALQLYELELAMSPLDSTANAGRTRALAWLGREAPGYWQSKHADGRRRRDTLREMAKRKWVSPFRLMQAEFAAGDTAAGFTALEQLASEGERALYKLPCMPEFDEVRGAARFVAIVQRVGGLPSK